MVATATFISDTVTFIRDRLSAGITDPMSNSRVNRERFVMTSYPERETRYPIISVKLSNAFTERTGQISEADWATMTIEVRVWARNVKERDFLFQQVHNFLRSNQFSGGTASVDDEDLHDFRLLSVVPIDEDGEAGIHSAVAEYEYKTVLV